MMRKKNNKVVTAWVIRFRDDGSFCPNCHPPQLFACRKLAREMIRESRFDESDEYRADAVQVEIRPIPPKKRKRK